MTAGNTFKKMFKIKLQTMMMNSFFASNISLDDKAGKIRDKLEYKSVPAIKIRADMAP